MRARILTLRFSPTLGAFDDTPLVELLRDKELLAFREHFFTVADVPHVACVLEWQEHVVPPQARPAAQASPRRGAERPDPSAGLTEPDRLLFNTLREWHAGVARREGVPPYVVFTNRQLLAIVARRPDSRTALGNLEQVGPAKVERYGGAVLAILQPKTAPAAPPAPARIAPAVAPDDPS